MSDTITEKHKKPIESAFGVAGGRMVAGLGLLGAGAFALGFGMSFLGWSMSSSSSSLTEIFKVVAPHFPTIRNISAGLILAGGVSLLSARSAMKRVTVKSKGTAQSVWDRVGMDLFGAGIGVAAASHFMGVGIANFIVQAIGHGQMVLTKPSLSAFALGLVASLPACGLTYDAFKTLRSFKKPQTNAAPNP